MKLSDIVLEAEGLGKRYSAFELEGVSFSLERGEVMGLIGPNGSGKTTTIRLLMGLARPDSGRARLFGLDSSRGGRVLEKVGFVYDECALYGCLSAIDNGRILAGAYRGWDDRRFRALLQELGVDSKKKVDELSKGQRAKFSLAVAMAHEAELLVLDEPTSGLDPVSRSEVLDLLYHFIADGRRSVLFSTHITSDLERIADRVTFLREGKLVFGEETSEVLARYAIVKGPVSAIASVKPFLEGLRETPTGFEGLGRRESELEGMGGLVLDKACLEDIVVYSTREDYRVRASA
jgi:ABC-type multidrug transport system, ATPase component